MNVSPTLPAQRALASPRRGRLGYLFRIARVYFSPSSGPLSFWYEEPCVNERAFEGKPAYFMRFQGKAEYRGPFDDNGVPLLDYLGDIGRQYNPIAIAQYGLARFNVWEASKDACDPRSWQASADWLVTAMRPNAHGVRVWMHDFDWPYREMLQAPWYSGLAQGSGLSLLVRAAEAMPDAHYGEAANAAFESMRRDVSNGGVLATDEAGDVWIEEYLVDPPSHILNGFIWALWGVHDYARWSGNREATALWHSCVGTLKRRLGDFDTGWWSLYEAEHNGRQMLASLYYHNLHITQLEVMHRLTKEPLFLETARRFRRYRDHRPNRFRALAHKALFKLRYY